VLVKKMFWKKCFLVHYCKVAKKRRASKMPVGTARDMLMLELPVTHLLDMCNPAESAIVAAVCRFFSIGWGHAIQLMMDYCGILRQQHDPLFLV